MLLFSTTITQQMVRIYHYTSTPLESFKLFFIHFLIDFRAKQNDKKNKPLLLVVVAFTTLLFGCNQQSKTDETASAAKQPSEDNYDRIVLPILPPTANPIT